MRSYKTVRPLKREKRKSLRPSSFCWCKDMIFVRVRQNAPYCAAGWQDSERSSFAKMRSNWILLQGAEATACYAACAPLLSSRASQEELADSISKNGSLSGIAELVSPITARKISRKHQYEYPSQIAINMSRLRRLVVALGLL